MAAVCMILWSPEILGKFRDAEWTHKCRAETPLPAQCGGTGRRQWVQQAPDAALLGCSLEKRPAVGSASVLEEAGGPVAGDWWAEPEGG